MTATRKRKGGSVSAGPLAFIPPRITRRNIEDAGFAPPLQDGNLARIVYHEASHAVVGLVTGQNPHFITVVPNGRFLGAVRTRNDLLSFAYTDQCPADIAIATVWSRVCVLLAGPMSDHLWFGEGDPIGYFDCGGLAIRGDKLARIRGDDIGEASKAAKKLLRWSDAETFYLDACLAVNRFLNSRSARVAVASVARRLHHKPELNEDEVRRTRWVRTAELLQSTEAIERFAAKIKHAGRRPAMFGRTDRRAKTMAKKLKG